MKKINLIPFARMWQPDRAHFAVVVEVESFLICNDYAVIFTAHQAQGMVGETIDWGSAQLLDISTGLTSEDLTYEDLKEIYKKVKGRRSRIHFWCWMDQYFSPRGKEQLAQATYHQAMSIVK